MGKLAVAEESWRDWSPADQAKQPRRTCSIAGCRAAPKRVKETTTKRDDGTKSTRRHVYCAKHAPVT